MKIHRWDTSGRDVTDLPGLWSESDLEVCQTNYGHPSITTGMHTNGPAAIWIRYIGGAWLHSSMKHMHKVRASWIALNAPAAE